MSRSYADIVRANLFTRFNAILGTLLAVIVVVGPFQDGLFGIVLVANLLIGIVQEVRAKRSLDRLTIVVAPRVTIVRDGETQTIDAHDVVLGDLVTISAGDQVPVDGALEDGAVEVDESVLTGESRPIPKAAGDEVLSGALVTAGTAWLRASAVGDDAYANRLAAEARQFRLVRSELRTGIDHMLRVVTWIIVPTAALLVGSQLIHNSNLFDAIRGSVAGVGSMIPEGLVLLTSTAFAVAVMRLARQGVLVRELAGVEGLAHVDVICIDKTGTLTELDSEVAAVERIDPDDADVDVDAVLGAVAAADPAPNATLRAIAAAFPSPGWTAVDRVPFSSSRRWSAVDLGTRGSWVLGGADVIIDNPGSAVVERAASRSAAGQRVVLLARTERLPSEGGRLDARPVALIALAERVRHDAAETLAFFRHQGVDVKVLSGDHPDTVQAIAERVGLTADGDGVVDASRLPDSGSDLADAVAKHHVFGRVRPAQKRAMVEALRSRGRVVAMTGDGVNDVPAMKAADLAVGMGAGAPATRLVADVVLLHNQFSALPSIVAEGRRVIGNVERVANLFLTKTVYATVLAVAVGFARIPFPFLPRHLTLISSLTIGIPGFFLALGPNDAPMRPGFLRRVFAFAGPAGAVAAVATLVAYGLARSTPSLGLAEARTTATVVLFGVGWWVILPLARPLSSQRMALVVVLLVSFVAACALDPAREFYGLALPPARLWAIAVLVTVTAAGSLSVLWRLRPPARQSRRG